MGKRYTALLDYCRKKDKPKEETSAVPVSEDSETSGDSHTSVDVDSNELIDVDAEECDAKACLHLERQLLRSNKKVNPSTLSSCAAGSKALTERLRRIGPLKLGAPRQVHYIVVVDGNANVPDGLPANCHFIHLKDEKSRQALHPIAIPTPPETAMLAPQHVLRIPSTNFQLPTSAPPRSEPAVGDKRGPSNDACDALSSKSPRLENDSLPLKKELQIE
jgi:hypothetical protein